MIQVFNLTKSFGGRALFEGLSFAVGSRERIGFVGRNGSGKSTLVKILVGIEKPDEGKVVIPSGYRLGYLDQHISFSKNTVIEESCLALSEDEQHDIYKAERILFGLGFSQDDLTREPTQFSGGYQLRINLTKTLLKNPDLLILDEPTNYLDIVSLRWLRQFLNTFPGEALLITHDRDFMDSVITHTMGLHRKGLKKVKGSTEKYYLQLMMDEEIYEKTRQNQERKVKEMERFVERFRAKASKASQAQSKLKQISKMDVLDALDHESRLGFHFNYLDTPAKTLMKVEEVGFSYGGDKASELFSDLSFSLKAKDRVAIVGANGKGKTTLLHVLAGQLSSSQGSITNHPKTSLGYYQQTNRKDLSPDYTVAEEIGAANLGLGLSEVRGICGAMMFPGSDADKKIKVLSGGEQGRVLLGKILARPANVLLLDEPSNHLDMESVEALTQEMETFAGGIIFVSHNENMLRRLANKLVVFRTGGAEVFLGGYDEFLEKIGWDESGPSTSRKSKLERKEVKKKRAQLVAEKSNHLRPLKQQLSQVEEELNQLESRLGEYNREVMEFIQNGASGHEIQEKYKAIGALQLEVESKYERMDEVMKKIDSVNNKYETQLAELDPNI